MAIPSTDEVTRASSSSSNSCSIATEIRIFFTAKQVCMACVANYVWSTVSISFFISFLVNVMMACCTYGSATPVTKTSLRDTPICLILCVPFLAIGWELCACLPRPRHSSHRGKCHTIGRLAQLPAVQKIWYPQVSQEHSILAMISRTLVWHHSHYLEVPLRGRRWLQATRRSSWRSTALLW